MNSKPAHISLGLATSYGYYVLRVPTRFQEQTHVVRSAFLLMRCSLQCLLKSTDVVAPPPFIVCIRKQRLHNSPKAAHLLLGPDRI